MTNLQTKVCTSCKTEKSLSSFNKKKTGKLGHSPMCRSCDNIKGKKYYDKVERVQPIYNSIIDLEGEIWKDILGYEGKYQISNLGRAKRCTCYVENKLGVKFLVNEAILLPKKVGRGYMTIQISKNDLKVRPYVHLLVWDTFSNEPRKKGFQIDHKDNVKTNNALVNLQQITIRLNSSKDRTPTTGYTGVTCRNGVYKTNIRINRQGYHLGTFTTAEEAEAAYNKAVSEANNGTFTKELKKKTSKYLGVSWDKTGKKWMAVCKRQYLGLFTTEEEAAQAYQTALNQLQNKAA